MPITYSDQEIASLVQERKPLPADWRARTRLKPKRGHHEQHLDLTGDAESEFRLIFRRSCINPFDFFHYPGDSSRRIESVVPTTPLQRQEP